MVTINFTHDLKEFFKQELSELGYPSRRQYNLEKTLHNYFDITHRLLPVRRWTIEKSPELIKKIESLQPRIREGLEKFIEDAQTGKYLKPYMSININNESFRDVMFYNWGIDHFHLGTSTIKKGKDQRFIKRTDEVLFAFADPDPDPDPSTLYFIDLLPHENSWFDKNLLEIIDKNWPKILERSTLQGIKTSNCSSEDIRILREAGMTPILQLNSGRVI